MAQYGIVSRRIVNNKECNILSDLLKVITNCHGQCDCTDGVYFHSSEPNEWCIGRYESFSLDPHLLERRVIKDISKASIIK